MRVCVEPDALENFHQIPVGKPDGSAKLSVAEAPVSLNEVE